MVRGDRLHESLYSALPGRRTKVEILWIAILDFHIRSDIHNVNIFCIFHNLFWCHIKEIQVLSMILYVPTLISIII